MTWDFDANPSRGVIAVLPWLDLTDPLEVRLDTFIFGEVGPRRGVLRSWRTDEVSSVPESVARSFPGAMHAAVDGLEVRFEPGRWPVGSRDRVAAALRRQGDVGAVLAEVARSIGADGVLVTWFTQLEGAPLTAEVLPGEIIGTEVGPVMVSFRDEPYRVTGELGMAWYGGDGGLVVRYVDRFEDVLTAERDSRDVGRRVARVLATEVAKVFPVDQALSPSWAGTEPSPERAALVGRSSALGAPRGVQEP